MRLLRVLVVVAVAAVLIPLAGCPQPQERVIDEPPEGAPAEVDPAAEAALTEEQPAVGMTGEPLTRAISEAEDLEVVEVSGGEAVAVDAEPDGPQWSGGRQLWWYDAEPGDTLTLRFQVGAAGQYDVILQPTSGPDYGKVTFTIDEGPATEVYDLAAGDDLGLAEPIWIPGVELSAGEHVLVVTAQEGLMPESPFNFGLDCMQLKTL